MNRILTGQLANRLTAFKRFQSNPKLEGRRVSPPSLDHRAAPPQAWCIAPLYTLARGPVFGAHFIMNLPKKRELYRILAKPLDRLRVSGELQGIVHALTEEKSSLKWRGRQLPIEAYKHEKNYREGN